MTFDRIDRLYFVTASEHKFNDYQFLLGKFADLRWSKLNLEDPVTTDLSILIRRKVNLVRKQLPYLPFLVEQTNLLIKSWRDLPGNVTSLFIEGVGVDGICKMLSPFNNRSARVITDLAYHAPNGDVHVFRGELSGTIASEPRGSRIFGWDAIFIPDDHKRTFGEMSIEQRNSISTRKLAVAAFYTAVLQEEQAELLLQNRIRLRELMMRYFNKSELEALCFDLGIDKDELPDGIKSELAQEIILYCERLGRIPHLLEICQRQRPNAEWPDNI